LRTPHDLYEHIFQIRLMQLQIFDGETGLANLGKDALYLIVMRHSERVLSRTCRLI
jgi:hypothetical protein